MTVARRRALDAEGCYSSTDEEFRVVCDSCHEVTEWTDSDVDVGDVLEHCRITAAEDGRHVCAVCRERMMVGAVAVAAAKASGEKVDKADVMKVADEIVGDERGSKAAPTERRPLAGSSFCFTGAVKAPSGRHVERLELAELVEQLGGHVVLTPTNADVLVVGETGRHGETAKMRKAREYGAEIRSAADFWAGLSKVVREDGRPRWLPPGPRPDLPPSAEVESLIGSALEEFDELDRELN